MGLGSLGGLNVVLSADTAQFSSAMEKAAFKAERDLQRISRGARISSSIIGTALVAAGAGIGAATLKFADLADSLNELSKKTGISVENLSRLRYASKLSGVEFESLGTSIARLNKSIASGNPVFKQLGIETRDANGNFRDTYSVMLDVADVMAKYQDGAGKSAAMQALMGRSAADLVPLFNDGSKGLIAYGNASDSFAATISTKAAQAADKFKDNVATLQTRIEGLVAQMAGPAVEAANKFWDAVQGPKNINKDQQFLIQNLMAAGTMYGANMNAITDVIMNHNEVMKQTMTESAEQIENVAAVAEEAKEKLEWNIPLEETKVRITGIYGETKKLNDSARDLGFSFQSAFEDAIIEGKKFGDVLLGLAHDIERIILRQTITTPLANAVTAGISSLFAPTQLATQVSAFGGGAQAYTAPNVGSLTFSRHGNVFDHGSLVPFATGGIVSRPTLFPMANGGTGLAGEAGKEAILPLARTASGDLGVKSSGGGGTVVNVYAPAGSNVKQNRKTEGDREIIDIMIDEAVAGHIGDPSSKTYRSMKNTFGVSQALTRR